MTGSRKRGWRLAGSLAVLLASWFIAHGQSQPAAGVKIPERLARELPDACRQALLVLTAAEDASAGKLWLMERQGGGGAWQAVKGPIPVSVGRNGLAWGVGEHRGEAPAGFRTKKEGDGCAPAGVFRIPFAFGYGPKAAEGLRLSYRALTADWFGVDDMQSKYYNQVVDARSVTRDWSSAETMLTQEGLYRRGAFIAHNPANAPGAGSCIFLHIWRGPGVSTSGCTAMAEEQLEQVLRWLDPAKGPHLVQGLEGW